MAAGSVLVLAQHAASPLPAVGTFRDDFTTADTAKWTFPASTGVSGGQLVVTPNSAYTAHVTSVLQYDLHADAAIVEFVQPPNVGTGSISAWFATWTDNVSGNALRWEWLNGNLIAEYLLNGVQTALATLTYDSTAHRWLRIRESGGTVFWDTSPDRQTWTQRASVTPGYPVTAIKVSFLGGYFGTEPTPGTAIFDNFNTLPPVTVTPDTATVTPSAFSPTVTTTVTVTPGVASSTAQAFAPTVSGTVTVTPGLASSTATAQAPTVTTSITATPDPAASTAQAFAPTVTTAVTVTPGVATSAPSAFAPAVTTTVTASPDLASSTPTAHAPNLVTTVTVATGLASSAPTAYAPVVSLEGGPTTVVPDLAVSTPQAFAPAVSTTVTAQPGIASSSPQAYAPSVVAAVTVTPDPATSSPVGYDPAVTTAIVVTPGVAASSAEAYEPTVDNPPPSATRDITVTFGRALTRRTATTPATRQTSGTAVRTLDTDLDADTRDLAGTASARTLTLTARS